MCYTDCCVSLEQMNQWADRHRSVLMIKDCLFFSKGQFSGILLKELKKTSKNRAIDKLLVALVTTFEWKSMSNTEHLHLTEGWSESTASLFIVTILHMTFQHCRSLQPKLKLDQIAPSAHRVSHLLKWIIYISNFIENVYKITESCSILIYKFLTPWNETVANVSMWCSWLFCVIRYTS